jgi:hypothetical protein
MKVRLQCVKCGLTMEEFPVFGEYPTRYFQCAFCKNGVYVEQVSKSAAGFEVGK